MSYQNTNTNKISEFPLIFSIKWEHLSYYLSVDWMKILFSRNDTEMFYQNGNTGIFPADLCFLEFSAQKSLKNQI